MTITITKGAATISPDLGLNYSAETTSTNVSHTIIGREDDDISLGADSLRKGTLELFFLDRPSAFAAQQAHRGIGVFTYLDTALPETNMLYVRDGSLSIRLENPHTQRWVVEVGFKEVLA